MKIEQLFSLTNHALDVGTRKLRRSLSKTRGDFSSPEDQNCPRNVYAPAAVSLAGVYRGRGSEARRAAPFTDRLYDTRPENRVTCDAARLLRPERWKEKAADPMAEQIKSERDVFLLRKQKLKEIAENNERRIAKLQALIKKERLKKKFSAREKASREGVPTFEQLLRENQVLLRQMRIR